MSHLPSGAVFTTESGYQFGVVSAEDIANVSDTTTCSHGLANVDDCQKCSVAGLFHRQIYRMAEWMQQQYGTSWEPGAARRMADEKTVEQCGFLPTITRIPAEADLPPLRPIKLSDLGLVAVPMPIEGAVDEFGLTLRRADGMEVNEVQRAILNAIANGAKWVA